MLLVNGELKTVMRKKTTSQCVYDGIGRINL